MGALIVDVLSSEAPEGVSLDFKDIRKQIFGFDDQIFDDSIHLWVGYFNTWNLRSEMLIRMIMYGNVAQIIEECGDDHIRHVL